MHSVVSDTVDLDQHLFASARRRRARDRRASLLVALPALNEEESVGDVVAEIRRRQDGADVLVIDDGSTDATAERASEAGAQVMRLPFNLGVGGAMRAAYRFALESGYTFVVQVDADGQHDPVDIGRLMAAMPDADVVVGSRFAGVGDYTMRGPRRWAMRLLSVILTRLTGVPVSDPTSGFRMIGPRALEVFAFDFPEEYLGDTVEALVIAHRAGLTIHQIPVAMRPRSAGQPSQGPLRSSAYLVRAMAAIGLAVARRGPNPASSSTPSTPSAPSTPDAGT